MVGGGGHVDTKYLLPLEWVVRASHSAMRNVRVLRIFLLKLTRVADFTTTLTDGSCVRHEIAHMRAFVCYRAWIISTK